MRAQMWILCQSPANPVAVRCESSVGRLQDLPEEDASLRIQCPSERPYHSKNSFMGMQIDICPDCKAVWLDGGEIVHIGNATRQKQAPKIQGRVSSMASYEHKRGLFENPSSRATTSILGALGSLAANLFD